MKQKQSIPSLGQRVKAYLSQQFPHHPARCAEILHVARKYRLYHILTQLRGVHYSPRKGLPEHRIQEHTICAENMAQALEELGTCFIKLGQMLSTRPDLLPPLYTTALSRLQYTITPVPGHQIALIIEEDLRASLDTLFRSFDFKPLATASIAQVHKALLHDGTPVVVKVLRPGVQKQIEVDIEILLEITRFITKYTALGERYQLISLVQEMRQSLVQELDFFQEADNTRCIGRDIQEFRHLTTPRIYPSHSSHHVLTLSFIPGRHLAQVSHAELCHFTPTVIAKELLFAYLKQIIISGVFHCDPHPGNLLLTDDGRLALLDFGMIGRLNTRQIENLILLLLAFSERQGERVAHTYLEMVGAPKRFNRRAFTQKICELVQRYHDSSKQCLDIGGALLELVKIASTYQISIPPNFALLGKALLNLDGTLRHLSPQLDIVQVIHHYLPQIIQQRALSQVSLGRSVAWLLDTKHLVENTLRKSDTLLENLASKQLATGEQVEHLDATIRRASLRLSLGIFFSSLILSIAFFYRPGQKCKK